jgi:hypothetical protein
MVSEVSLYKDLRDLGFRETRLRIFEIIVKERTGVRAEDVRQYLKDDYGIEISIQAVAKHLRNLHKGLFIKKREKLTDPYHHPYYVPSQTGIWLLKTTLDNVYKQYNIKPFSFDSEFRRRSVDFYSRMGEERSLADFETHLIDSEMEIKKDVVSFGPHWWFLKGYKSQVVEMMSRVTASGHNIFGICFQDNPVARDQASKAKGDLRIDLSVCSGSSLDNVYFYMYGPIFMMAFYPDDINRKVGQIFQSCRSLEEIPKKEFEDMLESRNPVRFAYAVNDVLASLWREQGKRILGSRVYPLV